MCCIRFVKVLRYGLQRVRGTRSRCCTDRGRRRGNIVGWMGGEAYGVLRGGIEGQEKVLGCWSTVNKAE